MPCSRAPAESGGFVSRVLSLIVVTGFLLLVHLGRHYYLLPKAYRIYLYLLYASDTRVHRCACERYTETCRSRHHWSLWSTHVSCAGPVRLNSSDSGPWPETETQLPHHGRAKSTSSTTFWTSFILNHFDIDHHNDVAILTQIYRPQGRRTTHPRAPHLHRAGWRSGFAFPRYSIVCQ